MKITVKTPATSANLGSAFDVCGIAFKLYNKLSFEKSDELGFDGCEERYANDKNLAYLAYKSVLDELGEKGEAKITFKKIGVPLMRGLGSSAALLAAGAYAANALYGKKLSDRDLLRICTKLEGHPDNVAPALFGGMCASVCNEEKVFCHKSEVSDKIKFTALIPDFKVSTKEARRVLPALVPFKDATFNSARCALLSEAFRSGDFDLIAEVTKDKLHQNYRKALFKNSEEIEKIAYEAGAKAFIVSGAGPTHLAISDKEIANELNARISSKENGWKAAH
ncbi:MAG: homoserine kinase, partial [Clostridia bacterium]|nr:homoserine kinase [Clostridia bacterium]